MDDPLADIEFLARSAYRVQILEELAERPCERAELQRKTEVARTTISRTLAEMDTKGWVESEGWRYELTPLGEAMFETFSQTIETTVTVQRLNRVIEWLPLEAMKLAPHHFQNATFTIASRNNPTLPARKFAQLKSTEGAARVLFHAIDPLAASEYRRVVEEENQQFEVAYSNGVYEDLRNHPTVVREVRQIAAEGRGTFYATDDEPPLQIVITGDTAGLLLPRKDGTFPAYIESQDETVISWARREFESYRENAAVVDPTELESQTSDQELSVDTS